MTIYVNTQVRSNVVGDINFSYKRSLRLKC